jgi:hypothetical protein
MLLEDDDATEDLHGLITESPASISDTANSRAFFLNNQDWSSQSAVALYATLNGTNTWIETTPATGYKTIGGPHEIDITGDIATTGSFFLTTPKTPSGAGDTGTVGQIAWDTSYLYVCTATDTWTRIALAW